MRASGFARVLILASFSASAGAGITSFDLSRYRVAGVYNLPSTAVEASAIAINPATGTLLILEDEGTLIIETTLTGVLVGSMSLTGFADTEGLTHVGSGQFVLAEERLQDLFLFTYVRGGSVSRASLQSVSLGPTIGNEGVEGVSFDPRDGSFVWIKEKLPMGVSRAAVNFTTSAATSTALFTPALGVSDLADVQALAIVTSLASTADHDNLLLVSQESARLVESTRAGIALSQFDLSGMFAKAEGVTIDQDGTIYVVDETARLMVLKPLCLADLTTGAVAGQPGYGVPDLSLIHI